MYTIIVIENIHQFFFNLYHILFIETSSLRLLYGYLNYFTCFVLHIVFLFYLPFSFFDLGTKLLKLYEKWMASKTPALVFPQYGFLPLPQLEDFLNIPYLIRAASIFLLKMR